MICGITRKSRIILAGWIVYWLAGSYQCIAVFLDIAGYGSYRLDWLDWIGWIGLDNNGWVRTHIFCKDGTDGTDGNDGLDGKLVGLGWYGQLLALAGTGATE